MKGPCVGHIKFIRLLLSKNSSIKKIYGDKTLW